jgi:hypothetical protein
MVLGRYLEEIAGFIMGRDVKTILSAPRTTVQRRTFVIKKDAKGFPLC